MSLWHPPAAFEPETLAFVVQNEAIDRRDDRVTHYSCTCMRLDIDDEWHLCEFHEGFDVGVAHLKHRPPTEWFYRDAMPVDDRS